MRYLADKAVGRLPQEKPMAAGAAFDACVKSAISGDIFGKGARPQFEFDTIFESQVEKQNYDFALDAGKHIFDCYVISGAYKDLTVLLLESVEEPRMEFTVTGAVGNSPFLGKPDLRFVLDRGQGRISCVYDFKVHGYCSKYGASPTKGYMLCRDGYEGKHSRSHMQEHTNYLAMDFRGLIINSGYMEHCSDEYADQLCLYGWLLGEQPGDENVVLGIEEVIAKYMGEGVSPQLRIANHRGRVSKKHQDLLLERVNKCWNAITSGHIFQDQSREDNDAQCAALDKMSGALLSDGSTRDQFFVDCVRSPKW
jgi:hypothetical protein